MPEWDELLPPVSCGERPIIDGVRTPVAYSSYLEMSSDTGTCMGLGACLNNMVPCNLDKL